MDGCEAPSLSLCRSAAGPASPVLPHSPRARPGASVAVSAGTVVRCTAGRAAAEPWWEGGLLVVAGCVAVSRPMGRGRSATGGGAEVVVVMGVGAHSSPLRSSKAREIPGGAILLRRCLSAVSTGRASGR